MRGSGGLLNRSFMPWSKGIKSRCLQKHCLSRSVGICSENENVLISGAILIIDWLTAELSGAFSLISPDTGGKGSKAGRRTKKAGSVLPAFLLTIYVLTNT